jgi:hypothetical protein
MRTKTAWTNEIIGNLFWNHVTANFLIPGRNTELIQELQFRQQRGNNSALSLFPSALSAGGKPSVVAGETATATEKKVGTRKKAAVKTEAKKTTSKASATLYTEAEAIEKFGASARTVTIAQPKGTSTTSRSPVTHKKGTQYCRHFLLQQLGVQNTDTKEPYTCARGTCRPGNHNLVTVDGKSSKKSIVEFLALQISVDSFAGAKAETAKKHLDAHIATLP